MNTNTRGKMRKMNFFGMFRAFKATLETNQLQTYTADELIANMVEAEWDDRQTDERKRIT
jgi:hypothetical protein